eukprot:3424601-Pyramimonas_sp.AAC.1
MVPPHVRFSLMLGSTRSCSCPRRAALPASAPSPPSSAASSSLAFPASASRAPRAPAQIQLRFTSPANNEILGGFIGHV